MNEMVTRHEIDHSDEDGYIPPQIIQFIVIRFGDEQFGIDIKYVDNIVRMQHVTRVPQVPNHIKGVINLRGEVIPVMSLRIKMGLEEDVITKSTRILILKLEQHGNIGILVDSVAEVVNLEDSYIEKFSHETREERSEFVYGVGKWDKGLISLLDLNVVVGEKDAV